jgi:hypothetical protein
MKASLRETIDAVRAVVYASVASPPKLWCVDCKHEHGTTVRYLVGPRARCCAVMSGEHWNRCHCARRTPWWAEGFRYLIARDCPIARAVLSARMAAKR